MSTRRKSKKLAGVLVLCFGVLCLGIVSPANATSSQSQPKTKKTKRPQKPQPPPLPSGPTGPVQQVPLDSMAPVPPQVSYQNAQLTIVAPNSTLGDILRAVRKQTGAEIEIPPATERVVTHLGPGPAREVMAELLNGSRFNYVLLGSPADNSVLTRVVLVAKATPDASPNAPPIVEQQQPGIAQHSANPGAPASELDANAAAATDDNTDDAADQAAAEAEQPPTSPDQPGVKTPQQMLQEMQQRQLQLQQQQQQSGQPPIPGQTVPPQPPPQQQQ
ncbi:MAG: hypothetical protein ABR881_07760 [Candidatus Sulfotelmatobacter sp.]